MYDYFVAAMICPQCGAVSPADSSTDMQTRLRDDARGIEIGVGFQFDPLEVRERDLESSGYLPVTLEHPVDQIQLLDTWTCPACHHTNWARVTIDGTKIVAIEAVTLDRATLAGAQFIAEGCYALAAQISGVPAADLLTHPEELVQILLSRLP